VQEDVTVLVYCNPRQKTKDQFYAVRSEELPVRNFLSESAGFSTRRHDIAATPVRGRVPPRRPSTIQPSTNAVRRRPARVELEEERFGRSIGSCFFIAIISSPGLKLWVNADQSGEEGLPAALNLGQLSEHFASVCSDVAPNGVLLGQKAEP
jgi:hypothetical protein